MNDGSGVAYMITNSLGYTLKQYQPDLLVC